MVATFPTIPSKMLTDDNRRRWHHSAIIVVREAQDIYNVSAQELRKAAITHLIKKHFFEELPQIFDNMSTNIQAEIQKNDDFSAESYRESRILYDMMKPFFDKIKYIKVPATISDEKEQYLYKSLVHFLNILKEYMGYLEIKFLELDTPQFKSTLLCPVPESELWAIRNKNRPYLV